MLLALTCSMLCAVALAVRRSSSLAPLPYHTHILPGVSRMNASPELSIFALSSTCTERVLAAEVPRTWNSDTPSLSAQRHHSFVWKRLEECNAETRGGGAGSGQKNPTKMPGIMWGGVRVVGVLRGLVLEAGGLAALVDDHLAAEQRDHVVRLLALLHPHLHRPPCPHNLTLLSTAEPIQPIQPSRQATLATLRKCRLGTAVLVVQRHRLQRARPLLVL